MVGVAIFEAIALCGCVFLIYFVIALWRDAKRSRQRHSRAIRAMRKSKLLQMPIRTVDTGYGIERWTWLTQGSTNAFESTYGEVLDSVIRLTGVKVEEPLVALL